VSTKAVRPLEGKRAKSITWFKGGGKKSSHKVKEFPGARNNEKSKSQGEKERTSKEKKTRNIEKQKNMGN